MYGLERRDIVLAFGNACKCQFRDIPAHGEARTQQDRLNLSFPAVQG